jgi:hypothetical protein
MKIPVDFSEE